MKRRKPDTLMLLAMLIGLGVIATGIVQGAIGDVTPPAMVSAQK